MAKAMGGSRKKSVKKARGSSVGSTTATRKTTTKRSTARKKAGKRETINTGRDTRYVRRNEGGEFEHVVEKGRSLAQDRRKKAKKTVPAGQGDKGDQKRRGKK